MLGMILTVCAGFAFVVWQSYRSARARARRGEAFAPEGKLRWSAAAPHTDDLASDRASS